MKLTKVILLIYFTFYFINSNSQTAVGIKLSGNYCGIWGPDKPQNFTPNWGFGGGVFLNPNSSSSLSPILEINYAHRVFDFTEPIILLDNSSLNVLEKNEFLEVPILIKINNDNEYMSAYATIGWQASFLLKNKKTLSATVDGHTISATDYYNFINNFYEYGFVLGGGMQYRAFISQGRYYFAMRNIHKGELSREMRYNTISLSIAYQLNYRPPRTFRKNSFFNELKHKIKRRFK